MKFACPKCGRVEEIIGASIALCLICWSKMVRATESYEGLWMSPNVVLRRMGTVVTEYGSSQGGSGRFKREREAYATAVWALGLAQETGLEYWIEIETADQTPDTKVHYIDQSSGHNHVKTLNVEVVDWMPGSDPFDVISRKCKRAYPEYFTLLVFGRNTIVFNPDKLSIQLQLLKVPFAAIWMVGPISETRAGMVRLYPSPSMIEFEISDALSRPRGLPDFMIKQKRGTGLEFKDLGPIYLPVPPRK